jgi:hypothetical protein
MVHDQPLYSDQIGPITAGGGEAGPRSDILSAGNRLNPNSANAAPTTPLEQLERQSANDLRTLLQGGENLGFDGRWRSSPFELPQDAGYGPASDQLDLRDMISEILQPTQLGDGALSFTLGGLGDFILERSPGGDRVHIFETETQLHVSLPTGENGYAQAGGGQGAETADKAPKSGLQSVRELAVRIRDFLLSGPRLVLIVLLAGVWFTWRVSRHISRRKAGRHDATV